MLLDLEMIKRTNNKNSHNYLLVNYLLDNDKAI